jgi:hypothetical protein
MLEYRCWRQSSSGSGSPSVWPIIEEPRAPERSRSITLAARRGHLDPLRHDARQGREFVTRFRFRLDDAGDHCGCLAVLGRAGEFEADAVGVVEVDAKQSPELHNRPDIVDAVRFQPRLDLAEALRRHDKGLTPDQGPGEGRRLPQGDALLLAVGKGW